MSEWRWLECVNKHDQTYWAGRHPCGLDCYIQRSTYNIKLTSTTLWRKGKRKKTDRWLNNERTTSFEAAKQWLEERDPWDVYDNYCKYDSDDNEPRFRQRGFF